MTVIKTITRLAILSTLLMLCSISGAAQTYLAYNQWCQTGAIKVTLSGITSTNTVQGSYPSCNVEVFIAGSNSHPPGGLFADNQGTPLANPFVATTTGQYLFYVAAAAHYDIVMSGGGLVTPVALTDVVITDVGSGSGGGGSGDVLLNPPSDEIFQAISPTAKLGAKCPVGAASGFPFWSLADQDGSNILSVQCGTKRLILADGTSGNWTAAWFGDSVGVLPDAGVFRCANTDVCMAWRNAAGTGNVTISKDNLDVIHISGTTTVKIGANTVVSATSTVAGRLNVSIDTNGDVSPTQILVDASAIGFLGTDDCNTIFNAATSAVALGQDVDARGLIGALGSNNFGCASQMIPDTYSGRIYLPPGIFWIRSNAASISIPARIDLIGVGVGRAQGGPNSGTIVKACNTANGSAGQSAACAGTTFSPLAGSFCVDGTPNPVPCPLVGWAKYTDHFAPSSLSFDTHVIGFDIDCNFVSGCIGLQNGMTPVTAACTAVNPSAKCGAQENSGPVNMRFDNYGNGAGIAINFLDGSQNSQIEDVNLINNSGTIADCSASKGLVISATGTRNGPKLVHSFTNTNTACTTPPVTAVDLEASEVLIDGMHCEQVSGQCLLIGATQDVKGFNTRDVNGVNPSGAVIKIASGHSVGGKAETTLNINTNGFVIWDDLHTFGGLPIKIRVQGPEGTNLVTDYGFDFGTTGADAIDSSSGFVPKAFNTSANWTAGAGAPFTAGECMKVVTGSDITLTRCAVGEIDAGIGFTRTAVTDVATIISLATFGVYSGAITDNACAARDYIYSSDSNAGRVKCSTTRPYNRRTYGWALAAQPTPGNPVLMFIDLWPAGQPVSLCNGTGANPLNCGSFNVGVTACPHASSAGTCQINTTAAIAAGTSVVHLTRSTQLGAACELAATDTALSLNAPIASVSSGNFIINVPTLPTALSFFCFNWSITNP